MKYEVVLIDDHALIREGLREALAREGDLVVVGEARSSREAIQVCDTKRPNAVLLDLWLGRDNGLSLISELRQRHPALKVLVLSMHDETIFAERALRAGAHGYVMKDLGSKVVIDALRRVLADKTHLSERLSERLLRTVSSSAPNDKNRRGIERLSAREIAVLQLIGQGDEPKKIAKHLGISTKTVEAHLAHIKDKLALESGRQLIVLAVNWLRFGSLDSR